MNNKRQPRPRGYTVLCQSYQSTQSNQTKKKTIKYLIELYITNRLKEYLGQTYKDKVLGLEDVGILAGVSERYILKIVNKDLEQQQDWYKDKLKMESRAVVQGLFFKCLQASNRAEKWASDLIEVCTERNYPAMLAQAANTAIANDLGSTDKVLNLLKHLPILFGTEGPKANQINITNQVNSVANQANQMYLTPEDAVKILAEKGLNEPTNPEMLFLTENLSDTPEVLAQLSDAQGRNNLNPKDLIFTSHEDRREAQYGIVEAEDIED